MAATGANAPFETTTLNGEVGGELNSVGGVSDGDFAPKGPKSP
jgi:hypothetical protein